MKQSSEKSNNPKNSAANTAEDSLAANGPAASAEPQLTPEDPVPVSTDPLADANAKIAELTNDLQRTRADFENYRKQVEIQRAQSAASASYVTVEKFLPLIDDFYRAIAMYPSQLAPLEKNLNKLLSSLKLTVIESKPGTEFNPDYHEAVSVSSADGEVEKISETLRPGYLYEGVVIRPAMVKVG